MARKPSAKVIANSLHEATQQAIADLPILLRKGGPSALGSHPLANHPPIELIAAAREVSKLWFGNAWLTMAGRDRVWKAMRRLKLAVEDVNSAY